MPGEPAKEAAVSARTGPAVAESAVTFRLSDPGRRLAGVRLLQDAPIPADQLDFRRHGDEWELSVGRLPLSRMEYLLELRYPDGARQAVPDPGNSLRAPGAFGDKSVVEFPSYAKPGWLTAPAEPGNSAVLDVQVPSLARAISVRTWSPADAGDDEPLPLLIAHDGPEYDALASLTRYLAAGVTGGWLPRLRAALLAPGPRDRWYSANATYARALTRTVIPAVTARVATSTRVGMGTSLGGLAMLHAHCHDPDAFDGLFLQSGSFFWPRFDSHERRFPYYRRIVRFVADLHRAGLPDQPVPVAMTCGVIEENAANNRLMAQTLRSHGYLANLDEVPDLHNYTSWRDAFDPYLTRLLWLVSQ